MSQYELKLISGGTAVWEGRDPLDAARRYVDAHPDQTVVATRPYPRTNVVVGGFDVRSFRDVILEPGHRLWGKRR